MIYGNILKTIGNTPIVKLNNLTTGLVPDIYCKVEAFNPCGSIKDRIALNMIINAEKKKQIDKDTTIIEPTSGNTGIGLAMVCAVKGYKLVLAMPESMSIERQKILKKLGANLILTSSKEGMTGSIERVHKLIKENQNYYMPDQFSNPSNPDIHRKTTATEIIENFPNKIDYLVCGVGTGGTITGIGETLKDKYKDIKIIAVEPFESAVLSGEKPSSHRIQGIGAGFVPKVLNRNIIDDVIKIRSDDAIKMSEKLAAEEGLFVGISSGAIVEACLKIAGRLKTSANIMTILPDTGERYLS